MGRSRRSMMRGRKPAWWLLYALLPLAVGLLVAAHLVSQSLAWREFTEGVASLVVIGAMALWVRANRVALVLEDYQQDPDRVIDTQGMAARKDRVETRSLRQGVDSHEDIIAA
jgi:hypothetical protein